MKQCLNDIGNDTRVTCQDTNSTFSCEWAGERISRNWTELGSTYFANVVTEARKTDTFCIFVTKWSVGTHSRSIVTSETLIPCKPTLALSAVERALRIDTAWVGYATAIILYAFINIVTTLSIPPCKFQTLALESRASSESGKGEM